MIRAARRWWHARSRRERWIAYVAVLVVIGSSVDALFFADLRSQSQRTARELAAARTELTRLQGLVAQHTEAGDAQTQARIAGLAERRARAEALVRAAQADLVPPQQMAAHLARLLERHTRLRVVAARSVAPVPVLEVGAAQGAATGVGLFQHGLEVTLEGRYLDLVAWLESLEASPHRVYWRELELQVGEQGLPVTKLALYTLSRESTWLKL